MEKHRLTLTLIVCLSIIVLPLQAVSETKKITRLRFYLQDFIGGDRPTVWGVAACNLTDVLPSLFGKLVVMDDPVTSGPELDSEEVGRLQGIAGLADFREEALVLLLNLVFTKGEFKGSTLSILGRNPLGAESREVSIVAGTGAFRMAAGYIITRTYYKDTAGVHNVYEYIAVVYHMDPAEIIDLLGHI